VDAGHRPHADLADLRRCSTSKQATASFWGLVLAARLSPAMHVPAASVQAVDAVVSPLPRRQSVSSLPCNLTRADDLLAHKHAAGLVLGTGPAWGGSTWPLESSLGSDRPSRNIAAQTMGDQRRQRSVLLLLLLLPLPLPPPLSNSLPPLGPMRHLGRSSPPPRETIWMAGPRPPVRLGVAPAARHKRTGSADKRAGRPPFLQHSNTIEYKSAALFCFFDAWQGQTPQLPLCVGSAQPQVMWQDEAMLQCEQQTLNGRPSSSMLAECVAWHPPTSPWPSGAPKLVVDMRSLLILVAQSVVAQNAARRSLWVDSASNETASGCWNDRRARARKRAYAHTHFIKTSSTAAKRKGAVHHVGQQG
jgi:hypothetical protein